MFFHMCEMSPSFEPKIAYKQIPPWMRMVVRWHRWKINHILLLKRSANNNSWVAQAITKWILSVNIWEFKNKRNKWFFHFCLMFYRISLPSFHFWYLSFLVPIYSALMSSLFFKFEFHWASELRLWTCYKFKNLLFFEFKLEFGDEFSNFWPEYYEYFKFYRVQVSLKQTCWVFEFRVAHSSITYLHRYISMPFSFTSVKFFGFLKEQYLAPNLLT